MVIRYALSGSAKWHDKATTIKIDQVQGRIGKTQKTLLLSFWCLWSKENNNLEYVSIKWNNVCITHDEIDYTYAVEKILK
jgi:hypothetical protein